MTDPRRCRGCNYWRPLNKCRGGTCCCHFLLATGRRRKIEDGVCRSRVAGTWRGGPTLYLPEAMGLTYAGYKVYRRPV